MRTLISILLIVTLTAGINAQEGWTLDRCIEYALENNISIRRSEISLRQAEINLSELKARRYPTLSISSNASINYGRSISPEDNIITFDPNFYNSYGVSSSLTLFNGFMLSNRISAGRYLVLAEASRLEQDKCRLALDIVDIYYRYLIARGITGSARANYDMASVQYHKAEAFEEAGKVSRSDVLEVQSQMSSANLLYIRAINDEKILLENLRLALRLDKDTTFSVAETVTDSSSVLVPEPREDFEYLYLSALTVVPSISVLEQNKSAREKEFDATRGLLVPSLSFYTGLQSTYFNALKGATQSLPYAEQIRNNINPYFGLSLSIPVFNRWSNLSNLRRARLNLLDSEFEIEQAKDELRKEVLLALTELNSLGEEYLASLDNLGYVMATLNTIEQKFYLGLASSTELEEARKNLLTARVDLIRTIIQIRVKQITIGYYQTGIIAEKTN